MPALGRRDHITVFGTDYDTPDGSCIRDYIHILDLARAHILALEHLQKGNDSFKCNLGTGIGRSVKEVIAAAEEVAGRPVPVEYGDRREGDPSELVGRSKLRQRAVGLGSGIQRSEKHPTDRLELELRPHWRALRGLRGISLARSPAAHSRHGGAEDREWSDRLLPPKNHMVRFIKVTVTSINQCPTHLFHEVNPLLPSSIF